MNSKEVYDKIEPEIFVLVNQLRLEQECKYLTNTIDSDLHYKVLNEITPRLKVIKICLQNERRFLLSQFGHLKDYEWIPSSQRIIALGKIIEDIDEVLK